MPYKDPQRKRQWEQEHREQRNARRRMQRLTVRSGQRTARKPASDLVTALRNIRRPATDPASDQKPQGSWKTILGWAIGIGVVLLAAFAAVDIAASSDLGASFGSGNSGI